MTPAPHQALRDQLAATIAGRQAVTHQVVRAFRTVPRHHFLPGIPPERAYQDTVIVTKRDDTGAALISASQPAIVATMLGMLDVRPGHRILEIGAGTGYNAALLSDLTGPAGQVTTIDIDPQAAAQARRNLAAAGCTQAGVVCGDGSDGVPESAPYDRIIVTAGAWDLPAAWTGQLAPGGRIVVPLRWRGQTRCIAFDDAGTHLASQSATLCGFIPMQADGERRARLAQDVALHYDQDQDVSPDTLAGILEQPPSQARSGVIVGPYDPFDGVWLRMTAHDNGTCRLAASRPAIDRGVATPAIAKHNPAVASGPSFAYLTSTRLPGGQARFELGAAGHGLDGADLAGRICDQIRAWDRHRDINLVAALFPGGTPDSQLPAGRVIDKQHTRLVLMV